VAPTGKQIERFLDSLVDHITPGPGSQQVPSFAWMTFGFSSLCQALYFNYADFELSRHDRVRIEAQMETHVQEGRLTKKSKRDKNWLGVHLMKRIVESLYADAWDNGALSWDTVLAKAQHLVIFFALGVRAGDITKDSRDRHELPFLAYQDVKIKILGHGPEDMIMDVTVRNLKGYKYVEKPPLAIAACYVLFCC
jgi:hypothetical protein